MASASSYVARYHPDVLRKDLKALDPGIRPAVERAIRERLLTEPMRFGLSLQGSLRGHRRLRVGDYRIVYRVVGDEVWILGIIHRSRVYREAERRAGTQIP